MLLTLLPLTRHGLELKSKAAERVGFFGKVCLSVGGGQPPPGMGPKVDLRDHMLLIQTRSPGVRETCLHVSLIEGAELKVRRSADQTYVIRWHSASSFNNSGAL